jgi:hypothetical protein
MELTLRNEAFENTRADKNNIIDEFNFCMTPIGMGSLLLWGADEA